MFEQGKNHSNIKDMNPTRSLYNNKLETISHPIRVNFSAFISK